MPDEKDVGNDKPFMAGLIVINIKSPGGTKEFQSNISAL